MTSRKHDRRTVQVASPVQRLPQHLLGRHVRAGAWLQPPRAPRAAAARNPEIGELSEAVAAHEHVRRLHVAVHDAELVRRRKRTEQLLEVVPSAREGHRGERAGPGHWRARACRSMSSRASRRRPLEHDGERPLPSARGPSGPTPRAVGPGDGAGAGMLPWRGERVALREPVRAHDVRVRQRAQRLCLAEEELPDGRTPPRGARAAPLMATSAGGVPAFGPPQLKYDQPGRSRPTMPPSPSGVPTTTWPHPRSTRQPSPTRVTGGDEANFRPHFGQNLACASTLVRQKAHAGASALASRRPGGRMADSRRPGASRLLNRVAWPAGFVRTSGDSFGPSQSILRSFRNDPAFVHVADRRRCAAPPRSPGTGRIGQRGRVHVSSVSSRAPARATSSPSKGREPTARWPSRWAFSAATQTTRSLSKRASRTPTVRPTTPSGYARSTSSRRWSPPTARVADGGAALQLGLRVPYTFVHGAGLTTNPDDPLRRSASNLDRAQG